MERYLGESVPKLGFGLMRLPALADGKIDIPQVCTMVDMFLQKGFRYFDTAYGYGNGASELAIGEALVKRYPRESFLLATKLPAWAGAKTADEAKAMLDTSLERTGAGYFDFYLLHNLGAERTDSFDRYGIWDYVQQKKKEGILRHVGFSFHDKAEVLDKILTAHPEMEFVQLQINYLDWESSSVESRKCYETARRHGKPVVIMEPVKGGNLANPPQAILDEFRAVDPNASASSWALRFAASLDGVIAVLSGMSNIAQMEDNLATMSGFRPLNEKEYQVIGKAVDAFNALIDVPCTACEYCMKGCPMNVNIPEIFASLNTLKRFGNLEGARGNYNWNTMGRGYSKASACVECGQCEEVCPQHIGIRETLKRAAATFE